MAPLNLDDLRRILVSCAGDNDGVDLDGDIIDRSFEDLGYDSLALLETAACIEREYGIDLADEDMAGMQTPRALLETVNGAVSAGAS
ncbi:granaticin polyketide synthase acyl carrier protein (ACP) [Streptomyces himastatinicus ATCC 53653]|uniref:Granaticin polyketide synthase acyl carrier protein (ACP) n=1 Tax=Streptomyces himastatinicus ATCC 53653 TaxID=457427 RepID=D9W8G0_9ACTN|nr:acyl carrier protein [Streptomyces himastatinicus]EFL22666.1 granaticin polyketide synthase acyl carrier protein (ACP) [Streptomyces himastatinicus ATCC 53653]